MTLLWPGKACGLQEGARDKLDSDSMHTPHDLPPPWLVHLAADLQTDLVVKLEHHGGAFHMITFTGHFFIQPMMDRHTAFCLL